MVKSSGQFSNISKFEAIAILQHFYIDSSQVMLCASALKSYLTCMCRLTAEGDKQCRCQVEYQLVYVTSVNAFIKKAIERGMLLCPKTGVSMRKSGICPCACFASFEQCYPGASNGITKNFETVQEVLKDFVAIRDASKAPVVKVSVLSNANGFVASPLWCVYGAIPHILSVCAAFRTCQDGRRR